MDVLKRKMIMIIALLLLASLLTAFTICIDPGHQEKANLSQEQIAPGSSETKAKVSTGTRGVNTGIPE